MERGFKGKCYPRLAKIVLSATLTQDPSKLSQLELHHPLLLNSGKKRYRIPTKLESYKLVCHLCLCSSFALVVKLLGNFIVHTHSDLFYVAIADM